MIGRNSLVKKIRKNFLDPHAESSL